MASPMPQEFVTEQTWDQYLDSTANDTDFLGYLHANKHLITWLDKTLETEMGFEQLKAELLKLRNERAQFADFAKHNYPGSA